MQITKLIQFTVMKRNHQLANLKNELKIGTTPAEYLNNENDGNNAI